MKEIIHLRKRYYFGYGYACNCAVGKGKKEKRTLFEALVTCKNCKKWYIQPKHKAIKKNLRGDGK